MDKVQKRNYFYKSLSFFLQRNWLYLLLGIVYLLGVLLGTFSLKLCDETLLDSLSAILTGSMSERKQYSFVQMATSSFLSNITFLVVLFFCGFCTIAQPVIVLVPFLKGLGYGASAGYIMALGGWGKYGYLLCIVAPGMFLFSLLTLFASGCAFKMSISLKEATRTAGKRESMPYLSSRQYLVKFLYFAIINYGISLLDALICTLLARFF